MIRMRSIHLTAWALACVLLASGGCAKTPKYGVEQVMRLPGKRGQVWAVAPAINLSGQREVDPLLQADLLYAQLQEVRGLTVIPVNRVAEVYAALRIEQVESAEQASLVCEVLGCDALVVPSVTAYDPYDPPKFGAALQMFTKPRTYARPASVDPRELARAAAPLESASLPQAPSFVQAVGMYDAANGSVREALFGYAKGRHDPLGPMGNREYLQSMDRYVGFAYHTLTQDLLRSAERASRKNAGKSM
jgi:hypothetical protein